MLILLVVAIVTVAIFWRFILKLGISAVIVGFIFLLGTGFLDIIHCLRALIP